MGLCLALNLALLTPYQLNQFGRPIFFLFNLFREQEPQDEEEPRVEEEEGTRHLLPELVAHHMPLLSRTESESTLEHNMPRAESSLEHNMPRAESSLEHNMPRRRKHPSLSSQIAIVVNEHRSILDVWDALFVRPLRSAQGGWMSLCFLFVVSVFVVCC
ncbi:hypothetical protein QVD17_31974 [Tagetes erecta]|uniref:Uncharacterized protein n=1 Tax=Tagetes erecta TaxID=13708 RepID=A0AAD8KAZ0_TARER|nr:hypothetical protein QVD17_31974 [Tagetes erecta]